MLFYQVLDANNRSVGEYSTLDFALKNAQDLTYWHTNHYYHVQEMVMPEEIRWSHRLAG